ncbi:LytR/AlgR family response regulator transcription factor [Maribacter dokdonensis]|uniref:LytR/AlgR family response regulator transcription factor n=1 Tax=Maribacter dokdonensis TaxID=320912 RepID=UPI001C09F59E|nr:LytTR family DNA-binding domain-containing protein [Maribacter dokdonensis]MBU2901139.1 LytTR family DNA-binding domain-containing protein [Maribacter dokdonensis]MDP2526342.1 LytTR family DNA-binding domain-containing protein [Maribacter dokdonensis]
MKVIIVEDELAASDNLAYLLTKIDPNIEIVTVLDTVKAAVDFFSNPFEGILVFMDIHLADGISFEIFDQVTINVPIIFTTAYDQYALKAFKVNSIDYLLKPIDQEELSDALDRFNAQNQKKGMDEQQMQSLLHLIQTKPNRYKQTFLVGIGDQLLPIKTADIAYFYIDTGVVKAVTVQERSYVLDIKLEEVEEALDPTLFYRANRQFIVRREAIVTIKLHFNSKLLVEVHPPCSERIVVSKAKASDFKSWVGR